MGKKWRISYLLIIILIAVLGLYVIWGGSVRMLSHWGSQLGQSIQVKAEQTLLPNLSYQSEGQKQSATQWLSEKAMSLMPIGGYVNNFESKSSQVEDQETFQMILEQQAKDENEVDENGNLIVKDGTQEVEAASAQPLDASLEKLNDFEYLVNNFYTVDSTTYIDSSDLPVETLLEKNMSINKESDGPKVLIYHTHSQEAFVDSVPRDKSTTIVGAGEKLAKLLNEQYGIETIHHQGVYDLIGGNLDRSMAYELAQPEIEQILADNPSIEVVIDLHRDGVGESTHLVTEIDGKPTAQVMFFNGLCRTRTQGDFAEFSNPYIQDNLAFSLQMKLAANEKYPGYTRRIYLKGYRYNMQLAPKTLLVETGAQTNTVEEIMNAMDPLAEILHSVLAE